MMPEFVAVMVVAFAIGTLCGVIAIIIVLMDGLGKSGRVNLGLFRIYGRMEYRDDE